jgi:hypothetical protein
MKTTLKTVKNNGETVLKPGNIIYRVDVYQKNQLGDFKGFFDNYMSALFETEHELIVSELQDMQPHSQISSIYIDELGNHEIIETYYFI